VATAKSGVPGHDIVRFDWVFGSNSFDSGPIVTKTFDTQGAYTVTLTVRDDLGITKTISKTVTVGLGLSADFTFSPTDPKVGTVITFDGSKSVAVSGIASFDWDFGDATGGATGKTVQHVYTAAATYVVRLTITDTTGKTATTSSSVTVK
jgi:PKD repeat protein